MYVTQRTIYIVKSLLYGFLSAAIMIQIFSFSAQTGESSSSLSDAVALLVLDMPIFNYLDNDAAQFSDAMHFTTFIIRKTAHMSEYAILSLCMSAFASNLKRAIENESSSDSVVKSSVLLIAAVFCVLYAGTDELHQTFIDGRSGQFADVLIDAVGITFGSLLYRIVCKCRMRKTAFKG